MTQAIDPIKLRAAAQHLEWVLHQYPGVEDLQALFRALTPLIESAKSGEIEVPMERSDVPGSYDFTDGLYRSYRAPSVDAAYTKFRTELRGGLTEQERALHADIAVYQDSLPESSS